MLHAVSRMQQCHASTHARSIFMRRILSFAWRTLKCSLSLSWRKLEPGPDRKRARYIFYFLDLAFELLVLCMVLCVLGAGRNADRSGLLFVARRCVRRRGRWGRDRRHDGRCWQMCVGCIISDYELPHSDKYQALIFRFHHRRCSSRRSATTRDLLSLSPPPVSVCASVWLR